MSTLQARRKALEDAVEQAIAALDAMDGDSDLEDGDEDVGCEDEGCDSDSEPDLYHEVPIYDGHDQRRVLTAWGQWREVG